MMENRKFYFIFYELLIIIFPIVLLFSNFLSELIIFLIIFFIFIERKNIKISKISKIFFILFCIFGIYLIINYFINFDKNPSITRSFFFLRFPLYALALNLILGCEEIKKKKIFFSWFIIILIILVDIQIQNKYEHNILGYPAILQGNFLRLGSFLNDELKIAYLINSFSMVVVGYCFFLAKKNNRYLLLAICFILFLTYSIYLTGERANLISLLFCICFLIFFTKNIKTYLVFFITSALLIFFLTSISEKNPKLNRMIFENVKNIKNILVKNDNSGFLYKENHYFAHYSTAYQIFLDNKIFGVGQKNFRNFCDNPNYNKKIHPSYIDRKCATHPHNLFFEIISEIGLLGFIVFYAIFSYVFFIFFKYSLKKQNFFLLSTSLMLVTFFLPLLPKGSFFTNWNAMIFWTLIGINLYLVDKYQNNND